MHVGVKIALGLGLVAGAGVLLAACNGGSDTNLPPEPDDDILRAADNATASDGRMHEAHEMLAHSPRSAVDGVQIIRAADNATSSDGRMLELLHHGLYSPHPAQGVVELMRAADNATASDGRVIEMFIHADRAQVDPFTAADIMRRADNATSSDGRAIELARDMFDHASVSGGLATTPGPVDVPPVGYPSGATSPGDD